GGRAGRRVRKSVVEQDSQDLPDSLGVADGLDVAGRAGAHDLERVRALRGGSRDLVGDVVDERTQWQGLTLETRGAGIQAREIEEVGRELLQTIDLAAHGGDELRPRRLVELLVLKQ